MNEEQLKESLNMLLFELNESENEQSDKKVLAKAVSLGMKYQELRMKEYINKFK